jgi:hypothetical protein
MMDRSVMRVFSAVILLLALVADGLSAENDYFQEIDIGLHVGLFMSPTPSASGDSTILVIRVSPAEYEFRLLNARELGNKGMTVRQWCRSFGLIAGINAGMFQADYLTHNGYMKNGDYIHNSAVSSKYMSALAFNPAGPKGHDIKMFDLDEVALSDIAKDYHTVIQNLRLIKRPRENKWSRQDRAWSEAALGQDGSGNILFIFSRSPYSMYDFNNILLALPIDIVCAQHLEGGAQASIYLSHKGIEIDEQGCIKHACNETEGLEGVWRIPNVLGFYKKEK